MIEMVGFEFDRIADALEIPGKNQQNKNPAGCWSGRGSRKIDDLNQIVNYLPASLAKSGLATLNLDCAVFISRPLLKSNMPTHNTIPRDPWIG